jgi:hypothetical protein
VDLLLLLLFAIVLAVVRPIVCHSAAKRRNLQFKSAFAEFIGEIKTQPTMISAILKYLLTAGEEM